MTNSLNRGNVSRREKLAQAQDSNTGEDYEDWASSRSLKVAASGRRSLIARISFPVRGNQFPVLANREFPHKPMK
jgi:hypothetical protein